MFAGGCYRGRFTGTKAKADAMDGLDRGRVLVESGDLETLMNLRAAVSHFELPARDPARAAAFYREVFGWATGERAHVARITVNFVRKNR